MASSVAIRDAIIRYWREGDYVVPMVGIVCLEIDGGDETDLESTLDQVKSEIRAHHGAKVDGAWDYLLAVFPAFEDAFSCAKRLCEHLNGRARIGVNFGEFQVDQAGHPIAGSIFARRLMDESGSGGICVSAVAGERITSRILDGQSKPGTEALWRKVLFTTLQWGALLGYFLGWFYLIYWQISYFKTHGKYPCWPAWMCA